MRTKTKKTKQITQIVVSMLLVLTMVFMPMKMILAADAQSSSTPTQFVLVLDCSGSMEESDVNGLSPKAAKMFVDMMPVENAQIAIVAFGANWGEDSYVYPGDTTSNTYTKVILGMTDVGTEKAKKKVKEAIDETAKVRDKNGYTTIGYALQAAKDVLKENKAAKANGCVVLMSDGRQYYLKNGQRGSEAQETKLDNGAEIYKSESLEAALKILKRKSGRCIHWKCLLISKTIMMKQDCIRQRNGKETVALRSLLVDSICSTLQMRQAEKSLLLLHSWKYRITLQESLISFMKEQRPEEFWSTVRLNQEKQIWILMLPR